MTEATYPSARPLPRAWSDRLAVEAVQNPRALSRLYAAHAIHLYRYFWIHTRSQAQAEDLVSETFLRALRSLPGYRVERGAFSSWLYGIARHALAYHVRQAASKAAEITNHEIAATAQARAATSAVSPDERIDLWQAVADLPEAEQDIIALKFGAGLTYPEIGEILGLRAGHVGVLLYRALQGLRARLSDEGGRDAE